MSFDRSVLSQAVHWNSLADRCDDTVEYNLHTPMIGVVDALTLGLRHVIVIIDSFDRGDMVRFNLLLLRVVVTIVSIFEAKWILGALLSPAARLEIEKGTP
jgi:hypothetical protein